MASTSFDASSFFGSTDGAAGVAADDEFSAFFAEGGFDATGQQHQQQAPPDGEMGAEAWLAMFEQGGGDEAAQPARSDRTGAGQQGALSSTGFTLDFAALGAFAPSTDTREREGATMPSAGGSAGAGAGAGACRPHSCGATPPSGATQSQSRASQRARDGAALRASSPAAAAGVQGSDGEALVRPRPPSCQRETPASSQSRVLQRQPPPGRAPSRTLAPATAVVATPATVVAATRPRADAAPPLREPVAAASAGRRAAPPPLPPAELEALRASAATLAAECTALTSAGGGATDDERRFRDSMAACAELTAQVRTASSNVALGVLRLLRASAPEPELAAFLGVDAATPLLHMLPPFMERLHKALPQRPQ